MIFEKFLAKLKDSRSNKRIESNKKVGKCVTLNNCLTSDFTSIGNNCYLQNVKINSFTYLSSNVTIMNTEIGKFCSIAQGVLIAGGMHPTHTHVSTSPVFFSTYKQCGTTFADRSYFSETGVCIIGNDVWIGANAIILDNITVGDGAIIGAGSIVTKPVEPYTIVAGNPAKIIKYRFSVEEINFLVKFKWWDKELNWLKKNFKDFHDIKNFKLKNDHS